MIWPPARSESRRLAERRKGQRVTRVKGQQVNGDGWVGAILGF